MGNEIEDILSGNPKKAPKALNKFVEKKIKTFVFPELEKSTKRTELWNALYNLANSTNDATVLKNCFIAIRILSREKTSINELFTDDWYKLILKHSGLNEANFNYTESQIVISVEVLKSLCNLIFNSKVVAAKCSSKENGILQFLTQQLKDLPNHFVPTEVIFFNVKILFLLTALCSEIRQKLKDEMDVHKSLIVLLESILKDAKSTSASLPDEKVDLVCEVLKALFNVTLKRFGEDEEEEPLCFQLVLILRIYILIPVSSKEKKIILQNNVINLLTNMPDKSYKYLMTQIEYKQEIPEKFCFENNDLSVYHEILQCLKEKFNDDFSVSRQEEIFSPIIAVLLKSANSDRAIRKYLRLQILPPLTDVHTRPEQGLTLRNHLCRLLTSPIIQLRDMIANLLFILCKMNVKRMIKYTGYGNAAGLFAQRGLLGGRSDDGEADYSSNSEDSDTEEYAKHRHGINPVTGCYEPPHANPMENMSEEQKEFEAMKLVQLIDDLTKCGTIRPCRVGADGKPEPIEHVLQLQEGLRSQHEDTDSE